MKLYGDRDIIEQGRHYTQHVEAMTAEALHSKSDIAAELAHRDIEIERLRSDAAKWQAIDNCARITAMGSAGLEMPDGTGYGHLTINLWTHGVRETDEFSRRWLRKFVELAIKVQKP